MSAFTCLYCRHGASRDYLSGCRDYYLGRPGAVDYVTCAACGLVQQHPLPTDLTSLYENYPVHTRKSAAHAAMRRLVMRDAYLDVSTLGAGTALLDYGCGDGWFLDALRGRAQVAAGFEFDAVHAESLTRRLGHPVYSDRGRLIEENRGRFDVVTLHFVLEHLPDPLAVLSVVREVLRPGGRLYVLVPNIASWESRLFRRAWHGLDAPRHIHFPGLTTMQGMASDTGFRIDQVRNVRFPNTSAASVAVMLAGRFRQPLFLALLPVGLLLSHARPGGSIAFHLTKTA